MKNIHGFSMLTTTGSLHFILYLYIRRGGNRLTRKLRTSHTEKETNEEDEKNGQKTYRVLCFFL